MIAQDLVVHVDPIGAGARCERVVGGGGLTAEVDRLSDRAEKQPPGLSGLANLLIALRLKSPDQFQAHHHIEQHRFYIFEVK